MIWTLNEFLLLVLEFGGLLVVLEVGYRLGLRKATAADGHALDHAGLLQGSVLGLLALLLGFSFAMAVERFDLRKSLVLEEANAIGTTALRAEFLPAPHSEKAQRLLHEYVSARLQFYAAGQDLNRLEQAQIRAADIQHQLWDMTVHLAHDTPRSVPTGLFIETLNDLIDDSEKRMAALDNRVPEAVILLLFGVAGVAMLLIAYHSGLTGHRRFGLNAVFALLIAVVITVILDIDRPRSGMVHVSQGSMERLRDSLDKHPIDSSQALHMLLENGQDQFITADPSAAVDVR